MSNPSGYRYTCICQQNKLIVHMCSQYMIEKLLMFYKNLHTGYLFFSIMKSRAFLTRILSHIRKTHMNHVIQIFKDRTKAISRAVEGLGSIIAHVFYLNDETLRCSMYQ